MKIWRTRDFRKALLEEPFVFINPQIEGTTFYFT